MPLPFNGFLQFFLFLLVFLAIHSLCVLFSEKKWIRINAIIFSLVYILFASIDTFIFTVILALYTSIYVHFDWKKWFILGVLPITLIFTAARLLSDFELLSVLFASFVYIRCLGTILWTNKFKKQKFLVPDVFLSIIFFPTFAIGPIQFADKINAANLAILPTWHDLGYGIKRFLIGFAMIAWLGPEFTSKIYPLILSHDTVIWLKPMLWLAACWAWLLNIYVMFAGYTSIAIGFCRILGFEVRENFDKPWLARTLQEFWQRWHLSLVWATNNLGYQPYVRKTGRRYIGVFLTFTFIGVWHAFSLNYLLWGMLHGFGLALLAWAVRQPKTKEWWKNSKNILYYNKILQLIGWFITMSYVAVLSRFASFTIT